MSFIVGAKVGHFYKDALGQVSHWDATVVEVLPDDQYRIDLGHIIIRVDGKDLKEHNDGKAVESEQKS
jgi:hypothetical protein